MAKSNIIKGTLEYRQYIVLEDGTEVRVNYNQNADLYKGSDIQLYEYSADEAVKDDKGNVERDANGKKIMQSVPHYAVPFGQAIRATRVSGAKATANTVEALLAQGLTNEEVIAKLMEAK